MIKTKKMNVNEKIAVKKCEFCKYANQTDFKVYSPIINLIGCRSSKLQFITLMLKIKVIFFFNLT